MKSDLVFKAGPGKRAAGWAVFLLGAGLLVATIYASYAHREALTTADKWSGVVIGLLLIGLMVIGFGIQYAYWSIEGSRITFHHLFGKREIPISRLAGFAQILFVVFVFPFAHIDLYDRDLKIIARLPVSFKDWPRAEAWLAERFRHVVNDGSHILPKHRFADTPKA